MSIVTTCEHCKEHLRVDDQYSGRKVKCGKCGCAVNVPIKLQPAHLPTMPPLASPLQNRDLYPPPLPRETKPRDTKPRPQVAKALEEMLVSKEPVEEWRDVEPTDRSLWEVACDLGNGVLIAAATLLAGGVFFLNYGATAPFLFFVEYLALFVWIGSIVWLLWPHSRRLPQAWRKPATVICALAAVALVFATETYDLVVEETENGRSVDTFYRWQSAPIHRRVRAKILDVNVYSSGPLTPSGKPHGQWKISGYGPGGSFKSDTWYWYGEPLSEGEFELRNRR